MIEHSRFVCFIIRDLVLLIKRGDKSLKEEIDISICGNTAYQSPCICVIYIAYIIKHGITSVSES
jgi:hypothetical protein